MRSITVPAITIGLVAAVAAFAAPPRAATPARATASVQALDDPTIVAIFESANEEDIATSDLAARRGSRKEVRDLGKMFARDHRQVLKQAKDLAKSLGVTPTPPPNDQSAKETAAVVASLRAKHGAAFDQAYLAHEVAFHQQVIDAVNKTLLPAIQNDKLRSLVTTVAPAFQAHLMAAQHLQSTLGD